MPAKLNQDDVDEAVEERGLTAAPGAALATYEAQGVSGEADPTDFVLPYLKLVQKMSKDGTPGTYLKSTGDETDHVDFVVLHLARTRTFYDGDAGELICASTDRVTGRPKNQDFADELGIEAGAPQACQVCPHFQDDQFTKLACKYDYLLTMYDLKAEEPFLFRVKGASLRVWRQRLAPVLSGKQPPWFKSFEMTITTKTNDRKQSWYEPEIKPIETHTEEQRAQWGAYASSFVAPVAGTTGGVDPDDLPFE